MAKPNLHFCMILCSSPHIPANTSTALPHTLSTPFVLGTTPASLNCPSPSLLTIIESLLSVAHWIFSLGVKIASLLISHSPCYTTSTISATSPRDHPCNFQPPSLLSSATHSIFSFGVKTASHSWSCIFCITPPQTPQLPHLSCLWNHPHNHPLLLSSLSHLIFSLGGENLLSCLISHSCPHTTSTTSLFMSLGPPSQIYTAPPTIIKCDTLNIWFGGQNHLPLSISHFPHTTSTTSANSLFIFLGPSCKFKPPFVCSFSSYSPSLFIYF